MDIATKQRVLNEIYGIYDRFAQTLEVACSAGCAACCTQNVTLTSNEAYRVVQRLQSDGRLARIVHGSGDLLRFRPAFTTNHLADLCISGQDVPVEENHTCQAKCPLLADDLCSVYSDRPFGCRCFVSKTDCRKSECADVEGFVLTVNTVFMQFIEHMDAPGVSGNFMDLLGVFASPANREAFAARRLDPAATGLLANRPISALLVPPEHQARIRPILSELQGINIS